MNESSRTEVKQFTHYAQAVDWITSLIPFGIKPGLKRMDQLMEMLDHPYRRLKFIHVAGTNGKGSTCAFLSQVLIQCGYTVGTFTSPYIEKFTNRIQCNGKDIKEEDLLSLVNLIKPLVEEIATSELGSPTMFEVTTALTIYYFARMACPDFVVWETGLGGRLDCTNIVHPIVSVLTNVGHDHMEILGDTLEKIAREKAGIIKSGVPVISAFEQLETIDIVKQTAKKKFSTLYLMGEQFGFELISAQEDEQVFQFWSPFGRTEPLTISLNGRHQLKNAAVALMTLEVLRQYYAAIIEVEDIKQAMKQTKWPGRLEMVATHPRILLDGAHNPEGAETLASTLKGTYSYGKLHFMMGMLAAKNHQGYLGHILPLVDTLILTEPDFRKKMNTGDLLEIVTEIRSRQPNPKPLEIILEPDWKTALARLTQLTGPEDLAVVSGTLYLISDVRSWILYQSDSEKGW